MMNCEHIQFYTMCVYERRNYKSIPYFPLIGRLLKSLGKGVASAAELALRNLVPGLPPVGRTNLLC